ncbi:MAG: winged helix-turn-helix domain-containing protein [Lysobacterales bacterium]
MNRAGPIIPEQHLFGRWRFDVNTGDLFDGETTRHLEPQVAKLLAYFLSHQETLTSRDELMAEVWDNRIVSDDAINRCISILRQVLSPDDRNAYIETVVRRGFISHFPPPPEEERSVNPLSQRKHYRVLVLLAGLVAVVLYSLSVTFIDAPQQTPDAKRHGSPKVAVLPFTTSGTEDDGEFFASGMHDDLLTALAQIQSMRVISRTSVLEYRNTHRNIRDIGRELGVDAILEGGIQRIGDQVRINVQLIDARSDGHMWAGQYDRDLTAANIFDVQAEIARSIAAELHASLTEQEILQLRVLPTDNMAAYRAYHRALDIRDKLDLDAPEYVKSLEEAVTLDPNFTRAWAELAGYLSFNNFARKDPDSIQQVEQVLEKIRTLAPNSAEYLIAQAFYTYYILRNYDQAYQLISQAQILRPSDERVLELKSNIQRRQGNFEGKVESIRMARTLDPRNPIWTSSIARNLILNHQYDEAGQEIENTNYQNFEQAAIYSMLQMRKHQDASRWAEDLLALQKEFEEVSVPLDMWESSIASRDYAAAEKWVGAMQTAGNHEYRLSITGFSGVDLYQLITYWFLQANDQLDPFLAQVRAHLDERQDSDGEFISEMQVLVMAFVTAAEGNPAETERLTRVWSRATSNDKALLANSWHLSCRALGMAAATAAAVNCIRTGLLEPSQVMPFMEPFLPYYDLIRDEPEFIGLLAEIQQGKANSRGW